jgi:plasmid maintenance system antidote protein VapI
MPQNPLDIGLLIRKFYISLGLTQKEFAEKIGYSRSYISEIITGNRTLSEDFKIKFKNQFRIDVKELITGNKLKSGKKNMAQEISAANYSDEHRELVNKLLEIMRGNNTQNKKIIKSNLDIMTMKENDIYSLDYKEWRDAGKPERRKIARM